MGSLGTGCFTCRNIARCSALTVLALAVIIGLFVAGVPTQLGLFRWLARRNFEARSFIGTAPAFMIPDDYRYTFKDVARTDLTGQTAVVTGANSGVGYWSSLHLARQGATLIMACRTPHKCDAAAARIRANFSTADITTLTIDTSKLKSVRGFAAECRRVLGDRALDMLFLNAGIGSAGFDDQGKLRLSEDGIELVFATNHVGHHLLYNLLEPSLQASRMARVVLTSSEQHFEPPPEYGVATDLETLNDPGENKLFAYGQSKLAQVLFAQELTRRLPPDSNIYVNSLHPGAVDTGIFAKSISANLRDYKIIALAATWLFEKLQRGFFWSGEDGSLTMLYLGMATDALKKGNVRGQYFHPRAVPVAPHDRFATDPALGQAVWKFTESLIERHG